MYIADWNSIQSNDWKIKRRSGTFSEESGSPRGIQRQLPRHDVGRGGPLEGLKRATFWTSKSVVKKFFFKKKFTRSICCPRVCPANGCILSSYSSHRPKAAEHDIGRTTAAAFRRGTFGRRHFLMGAHRRKQ